MRRLLPALLLLLAACQPLPHPFAGDRPPALSPMLMPPDSAGIVVLPMAGAPAPAGGQLAEAMAAALRDAGVPASTQAGNQGSFRLAGTAREAVAGGHPAVAIDWTLRDAAGVTIGKHSQTVPETDAAWRAGGEAFAKAVARQAAPAIARLVQGDAPVAAANVDPVVAVTPVTGAPGDGDRALTRAMGAVLKRARIAIAAKGGPPATFVLTGGVALSPPQAGKQQVKVSWTLKRPDGGQIGQVNQENAVPAGSLDGAWGDIAYAVANAAAPGITALIERANAAQAAGS